MGSSGENTTEAGLPDFALRAVESGRIWLGQVFIEDILRWDRVSAAGKATPHHGEIGGGRLNSPSSKPGSPSVRHPGPLFSVGLTSALRPLPSAA